MPENATLTIINRDGGQSPFEVNTQIPRQTQASQNVNRSVNASGLIATAGIGVAKKLVNNITSKVGDRSGNRQYQNEINNITKTFSIVSNIAQGGAGGFALGGGAGAIVGASIATIQQTIDIGIQQQEYNRQVELDTFSRQVESKNALAINSNNRQRGND